MEESNAGPTTVREAGFSVYTGEKPRAGRDVVRWGAINNQSHAEHWSYELSLSQAAVASLGAPHWVQLAWNPKTRELAIVPCRNDALGRRPVRGRGAIAVTGLTRRLIREGHLPDPMPHAVYPLRHTDANGKPLGYAVFALDDAELTEAAKRKLRQ